MTFLFRFIGCLPRLGFSFLIVAMLLSFKSAIAQDDLKSLLADYHAYGLPQPSDLAGLAVLKWSDCVVNGVSQYERAVVLLEPPNEAGESIYWFGSRTFGVPSRVSVTPTKPLTAIVDETSPESPAISYHNVFATDPDLLLAIHCARRGWNDLALALLQRSRNSPPDRFERQTVRPRKDRTALANVAWSYWCEEFCREKGSREHIVSRLSSLNQSNLGLSSAAHQNVLTDMRLTLLPAQSPTEELEATIDSLVDSGIDGGWGNDLASLSALKRNASYRKLEAMGLDAVPLLLKHTQDFRMTRCVDSDHRGPWIVRISDVVLELLNGLSGKPFAYDSLAREGRGRCVDRDHVLFWWSQTKGIDATKYMLNNAITVGDDGKLEANAVALRSLGRSNPKELVTLFTKNVERVEYADSLFEAIAASSIPKSEKAKLFITSSQSQNSRTRESAIEQLLKIKHEQAVSKLVAELDRLPLTPKEAYWLASAGRVARLLCFTDDEQAWAACVRNAKRVDVGQRLEMIQTIANMGENSRDRAIAFLVQFLDDNETRELKQPSSFKSTDDYIKSMESDLFSGPSAGFTFARLSVRNFAALELADKLGLSATADAAWDEADWLALQQKVRKALEEMAP